MDKIKPRLIIVLTLIMIVSALVLTFIYQETTPLIKEHAAKAKEEAILAVIPGAVQYKELTKRAGDKNLTIYQGLDEAGDSVGVALENSGAGFSPEIGLMIGMNIEAKKVTGIKILEQTETPGLGARITEKSFKAQFKGKSFSHSFKAKEDVDAITGATISSQAVSDIIKEAIEKIDKAYGGGE